MKKLMIGLTVCALLVGCTTVFNTVITVTKIVDSAMTQWARASNSGQTTPDFDAKVVAAHDQYRKSAAVAQGLFKTYKATNNAQDLESALQAARDGALPLVDLIAGILNPIAGTQLKSDLMKASKP